MCWIDARLRTNEGTVCRASAWRFAEMFADGFLPAECERGEEELESGGLRSDSDRSSNKRLPYLVSLSQSRQRLSGSSMHVSGWQCPRRA